MNLGDMVVAKTGAGEQEGRIVGRTLEDEPRYNVETEKSGIILNIPANHVQPAAPTAKPTPLAAPKTTNVSQSPREIYRATAETAKQVA